MSPLRKFAAHQIQRLCGLPNWANLEKAAKSELADTLAAVAQNEFHARRIVDDLLRSSQWVPTPAEVRAQAAGSRATPEPPGSGGCSQCEHTGRVSNWYLYSVERTPSGAIRRTRMELIEPRADIAPHGLACWLMYEPTLPTGDDQCIRIASAYCGCNLGQRLRTGAEARRNEEMAHA